MLQAIYEVHITVKGEFRQALHDEIIDAGGNAVNWHSELTYEDRTEWIGTMYLTLGDFNILNEEIVNQPMFGGAYAELGMQEGEY